MKNLYLAIMILLLTFSCKQKKDVQPDMIVEETIDNSSELESFEKEIENIAIGGKGIVFEANGKMSFDIEILNKTAKQVEEKLNKIKADNSYESKSMKKNAIESMVLNLNLFRGTFCCTTHNGKHCIDSKELKKLTKEYGCDRFMKKE